MACPNAATWQPAMDCERTSLTEMGAFEEVDLPTDKNTIGLKWVYAYKKDAEGNNILEKARVVAQGFNQQPGRFDETYAQDNKCLYSSYMGSCLKSQNISIPL